MPWSVVCWSRSWTVSQAACSVLVCDWGCVTTPSLSIWCPWLPYRVPCRIQSDVLCWLWHGDDTLMTHSHDVLWVCDTVYSLSLTKEHRENVSSACHLHVKANKGHLIGLDKVRVLDTATTDTKLKVKELLHILNRKPELNKQLGSQSSYEINTLHVLSHSKRCQIKSRTQSNSLYFINSINDMVELTIKS